MPTDTEQSITYERARAAQILAVRRRARRLGTRLAPRPPAAEDAARLSPSQRQGRLAEERACAHLMQHGLAVIARNLRAGAGEIDLVCRHGGTLVFVEVRWRRSRRYGGASASVDFRKQRRLLKTAALLLPVLVRRHFQGRMPPCRFDVVAMDGESLAWMQNAFALP